MCLWRAWPRGAGIVPKLLTGVRGRGTVAASGGKHSAGEGTGMAGTTSGSVSGRITCFGLVLLFSLIALSQGRAATWLEKNFWLSGPRYSRDMPACDYPGALDRIIANFHTKEIRFWNSELRIVGVEDIREIATMPWAAQSIPRRFCSGTAVINDGAKHPIYYSIGEDTGIIGMDYGVNFCVAGLDRDWAYNPSCRSARP
jgi:hypothetical protein